MQNYWEMVEIWHVAKYMAAILDFKNVVRNT